MQTAVTWVVSLFLLCCLFAFNPADAASKEQWKSRSIYQIVTDRFARTDGSITAPCDPDDDDYCGGTFRGIINKLGYIQNLGFSAIWISPVTYPVQGATKDSSAYHGYWQQDLYRINPEFGTADDLRALSKALHSRGMYLMVDVVVNNFAWAGNHTSIDYRQFNPFGSPDYFHPYRSLSEDPGNETCVQDCWLGDDSVSLPDLRTEDRAVMTKTYSWIKELVLNYTVDGLRVGSVFNVDKLFLSGFSQAAGVYTLGEGDTGSASSLCSLQGNMDGLLNYPMYYSLVDAFNDTDASMAGLLDQMASTRMQCKDITTLGTFSENQDVPRFASYTKDMSLARNIITYNILGDGIPVLYYGQEQQFDGSHDPVNREALWQTSYKNTTTPLPHLIQTLNKLRTHAAGMGTQYSEESSDSKDYLSYNSDAVLNSTHTIAIRKGYAGNQVITVLSNLGSHPHRDSRKTFTLHAGGTGFHPGQNVTEVLSCKVTTADWSDGHIRVVLDDGGPRVFYPSNSLNHSGLCGFDGPGEKKKQASGASGLLGSQSQQRRRGSLGVLVVWFVFGILMV